MKDVHQLLRSGQIDAALTTLTERIAVAPHDGELLLLKGVALFQSGAVGESEQAFRQALGLGWHTVTQSWKNLASICYRDRRFSEAVDFIAQYRETNPYDRDSLTLHVSALVEMGRFPEAEKVLGKYLEVFPDDPEALFALSSCMGLQGRYLEMLGYTGRLSEPEWRNPRIVRFIAAGLSALGLLEAAREIVVREYGPGARSASDRNEAMFRYLSAEHALAEHRFAEAIELYQTSIQGCDEVNVGLFNLSIANLAAGRLGEGWRLMRVRASLFSMATVRGVATWDGQELAGKRLLVHSEQGVGDVIQFIRYIPMLERAGVSVVFNAYPEVLRLLGNDPRARAAVAAKVDLREHQFDFQAQLLDLPAMLGTESVADIPSLVPYLYANAERQAFWRRRLAANPGIKVGLVWAGNPRHGQDHHRSARLADFESLAVLPRITWVILQKGEGDGEGLSPPEGMAVIRLSDEVASFDDTAAIIECLDLVVSVDTSVAHLAGALGKPVWILLAESGKDWRWFLAPESSPWYPSARLLTRPRNASWREFIGDVVRPALAQWLYDRQPPGCSRELVRGTLNELLTTGRGEGDPAAWVAFWRKDGLDPLPLARAYLLERGEASALEALCAFAPNDVKVLSAYAEALLLRGEAGRAVDQWRVLSEGDAGLPASGFIAWGGHLHEQSLYADAGAVWERALQAFPDHPQVQYMAGRSAQWAGLRDAAVAHYERALALSPRHPQAHNNRGILYEQNAPLQALACYQRALMFDNGYVKSWQNATRVLLRLNASKVAVMLMRGRFGTAKSTAERISFASALAESEETDEAKAIVRQIQKDGDVQDQDFLMDLAVLFRETDEPDRCDETLHDLVTRFPNYRPGQMFYGWQLLSEGDCQQGWPHYVAGSDIKQTLIPEWRGEPLGGKSLLVFQDQGMGDLFQFVSLVRLIPEGADITLAVSDSALTYIKYQDWTCKVVASSSIDWLATDYDYQIAQMKLPHILHIDLAQPPARPPYLRAARALLPYWENLCAADRKIKVGVVWAGNPGYLNDFRRSTRLRDWLPLFELRQVSFYSLQKDVASNQALAWSDLQLRNIAVDCDGWEKTASALMLLDLVISVDTGVAHLAACLGKPTWILLPNRGTDYRWQQVREDVPWYPQARLFRQGKKESWAQVLLRVKDRLANDLPFFSDHA